MSRWFSGLIIVGLLAGCQGQVETTPQPIVPVKVQITPALDWLRPSMAACAEENPDLSLTVQSANLTDQTLDTAGVLLRWTDADTDQGKTFKLGEDRLAFIVHPDNLLEEIENSQLAAVFSGSTLDWTELQQGASGAIQPWVYPTGDDAQALFDKNVLPFDELIGTARIAPDPQTMLEAVGSDPLAIGYIPARWLNSSVKAIKITGDTEQEWTLPILAVTANEPAGPVRDWLLCVQDKIEP